VSPSGDGVVGISDSAGNVKLVELAMENATPSKANFVSAMFHSVWSFESPALVAIT
jgi:hypothetical protein